MASWNEKGVAEPLFVIDQETQHSLASSPNASSPVQSLRFHRLALIYSDIRHVECVPPRLRPPAEGL